jgi:hypothetical protein
MEQDLQRFGQLLSMKIASEETDLRLPATGMVQIVDTAHPGLRPVRPNNPFDILIGIVVGGVGGLVLGTLIYVMQRRAYRRAAAMSRAQLPTRFRAIVHILIALVIGLIVGYHCAQPLTYTTMIVVPLTLLLGAIASACLELANPLERLKPEAPPGETGKLQINSKPGY